MAEYLRLLFGHLLLFLQGAGFRPPPALDADAVARDGFAFGFPLGVPVDAFARAGFQPGHADGPGAVSVLATLDAGRERFDRVGVLEKLAQGAGWACGGFYGAAVAASGDEAA